MFFVIISTFLNNIYVNNYLAITHSYGISLNIGVAVKLLFFVLLLYKQLLGIQHRRGFYQGSVPAGGKFNCNRPVAIFTHRYCDISIFRLSACNSLADTSRDCLFQHDHDVVKYAR